MSTPKLFGSVIVSRNKVKSLMDIANELEEKDAITKSASVESVNKKVTASEESIEAEVKVEETAEVKVEETAEVQVEETAEVQVTLDDEVVESEVKQANTNVKFVKVAKLTDKDRAYLKKYYEAYYPADYVDALLATY